MATFANPVSKLIELLSSNSQSPSLKIVDKILFHLGIADIYALHAACWSLRWLVSYMPQSPNLLNIDNQLRPFVKDPVRFRYELGKHDGLIAGEFVRNFFEFGRWKVPLLLVYVQQGSKSRGFIEYLCDEEQYSRESDVVRITTSAISSIFSRENFQDRQICIMATRNLPIVEIINTAYTTAGADVISWNKAYSLFPIPTVALHKFYPLKTLDDDFGHLLRNRAERGWTTRDMLWPDLTTRGIPQRECRQVADSSSLVIQLGSPPQGDFTPDFVLDSAVFCVLQEEHVQLGSKMPLSISAEPITSIALRYTHTNGKIGTAYKRWMKFLDERLDRWIYVEIVKMKREQRPRGFYFLAPGHYHITIPQGYELPDTWDYADDQVATWFREWEREMEM